MLYTPAEWAGSKLARLEIDTLDFGDPIKRWWR